MRVFNSGLRCRGFAPFDMVGNSAPTLINSKVGVLNAFQEMGDDVNRPAVADRSVAVGDGDPVRVAWRERL